MSVMDWAELLYGTCVMLMPAVPANNLAELIALAKAKPGTLNYGSAGVASLAHLATALFASTAGISITHVPYKLSLIHI